jgi:3-hydroxyisobutyrate dehydrogenase-like beta-hydroxyacid dehydrogenase
MLEVVIRCGNGFYGFIGLGVMGREMASHLVAAGHTVQTFDVNAKAEHFA